MIPKNIIKTTQINNQILTYGYWRSQSYLTINYSKQSIIHLTVFEDPRVVKHIPTVSKDPSVSLYVTLNVILCVNYFVFWCNTPIIYINFRK